METTKVNVNQLERIGSATLGGALLVRSFRHPSLGKVVLALDLLYRGVSGHSSLYQVLGVSTADGSKQQAREAQAGTPEIERVITIGKPADELYRLWRTPQTLSQILGDVAEVTEVSKERAHWKMRVPPGLSAEWDAHILEDRPGEFLRWKSLEGAQLPNEGSIRFQPAPGERGTEVTLHFRFDPPGGALGTTVAKRLGFLPRMVADKVLRRLKSLAETGEIPTLAHNPAARPGTQISSQARPHIRAQSHVAAQAQ
jgi:uncharacterized membrane protein